MEGGLQRDRNKEQAIQAESEFRKHSTFRKHSLTLYLRNLGPREIGTTYFQSVLQMPSSHLQSSLCHVALWLVVCLSYLLPSENISTGIKSYSSKFLALDIQVPSI